MDRDYFRSTFLPTIATAASRIVLTVASTIGWIVIAVDLFQRLQTAKYGAAVTSAGLLMLLSAMLVGPYCWQIFAAAPESNSRKALSVLILFGFMLQITGLAIRWLA